MVSMPKSRSNVKLKRTEEAKLPTRYGEFRLTAFTDNEEGVHLAIVKGDVLGGEGVPVRIHSSCLTGESLGSLRCDCGPQLRAAMRRIQAEGRGVIVYLQQEGRGIGLSNKVRVYHMQDEGFDTISANTTLGFDADMRSYEVAGQILKDLGVKSVILLTNNPAKIMELEKQGIKVRGFSKISIRKNQYNKRYIETKKKMGHML